MTVQDDIEITQGMLKLLKLLDKLTDRVIALEERTDAINLRSHVLQKSVDKLRNK